MHKLIALFLTTKVYVFGIDKEHLLISFEGTPLYLEEYYIVEGGIDKFDSLKINYYLAQGLDTVSAKSRKEAIKLYLER